MIFHTKPVVSASTKRNLYDFSHKTGGSGPIQAQFVWFFT